jgi:CAAX protease family protein
MKVSDDTTEAPSIPVAAEVSAWPNRTQPIAPWWHTILLTLVIVGVSILSSLHSKSVGFGGSHNIRRYAITIAWEWVLALIAWWGLWMRRTPMREALGLRRAGPREWARDFGIALIFWIMAILVLGAIAALLRLFHLVQPEKVIMAIAPQTLAQVLVWVALCATAGMVEEFVFRGYLLQQFSSLAKNLGPRGKLTIGVIASSLLFGAAHGYEGIGGMIAITAYGAMFCILAIRRRSLRAGMIAHAWHDSVTGIALAIAKHTHLI